MNVDLGLFKIYLSSPNSLLIEWDSKLTPKSISAMQAFKNQLLVDNDIHFVTSAFKSMLVKYLDIEIDISDKKQQIEKQLRSFEAESSKELNPKTFKIPVCYDHFGKDLQNISKQTELKESEVIQIHTKSIYTLYFIGFLPGFLYLGDVDKRIQMPRLQTPRQNVEKGSIGIAENQTGIYPMNSPGGWQIIGRTPLNLFDVDKATPSPFSPGDQIQFYNIDKAEFDNLKKTDLSIKNFIRYD